MGCQGSKSAPSSPKKQQNWGETQESIAQQYAKTNANRKNISQSLTKINNKSLRWLQSNKSSTFGQELNTYIQQIQEKIEQKQERELSIEEYEEPEQNFEEVFVLSREQCNQLKISRGAGVSLTKPEYEQLVQKLGLQKDNKNSSNKTI